MRVQSNAITITLLFASVAFGQSVQSQEVERTFHFTTTPTRQAFQEAATVLHTVGSIRQLTIDAGSGTLSVRGTPAEIAVAEWLVRQLDQPAGSAPPVQRIPDTAIHEYRIPGSQDDVIRVAYLTDTSAPRGVQELLTVLRTVADLQKTFPYGPANAIAYRGTTGEITMSDWLIHQLDHPAGGQTPGVHEYTGPGSYSAPGNGDDVTRVFYPEYLRTARDLNAVLTEGRANLHIMKAFACTGPAAVVFRGTADQIDKAARLVTTLDRPPAN